jgi:putative tryptophan/tyrosine transport system substrate-binding protein
MRRRDFMALAGAAAVLPSSAWSQSALPVIGFVGNGSSLSWRDRVAAFLKGLDDTGFVDGKSVKVEFRWAEGVDSRLAALISDLAARHVAVLAATGGGITALTARQVAPAIPMVFAIGADPVKLGLVKSFNKPQGNATGVSFLANTVLTKQVTILHEMIGRDTPIGFLVNPANPNAESDTAEVAATAESLGHKLLLAKVRAQADIPAAIDDLARQHAAALLIFPDAIFTTNRTQLAELAAKSRLPAIYNAPEFAADGGLLSYGADQNEAYRHAGTYAGRILKGEKPADLPVVQSSRFQFIVNLKTARALGITLPATLLGTADEVIE